MPIACLLSPLEWRRAAQADGWGARTLPAVAATVADVAGCACFALAWFTMSVPAFTGTVLPTAAVALTHGRDRDPTAATTGLSRRRRARA